MRILHISQSLIGGLASYIEELADYQSSVFGPENVRFLFPQGNSHLVPLIPASQIREFAPCERNYRGLSALGLSAYKVAREFSPTIVHLHSTFTGAIVRPMLFLARGRFGVVYCPHGWAFSMECAEWKRRLYAAVERALLPFTDAVINISSFEHECALRYGLSPRKLHVVKSGISREPPGEIGSKADADDSTQEVRLIFVGRNNPAKGLDYLLDALAVGISPRIRLTLVGPEVTLQEKVKADVAFVGWKSRLEVQALIGESDAVIMPSRWEGFGLVALEAMRLGKPVIASRRGALPEIVQHGETGILFEPGDPRHLATLLSDLDRKSLQAMGRRAKALFHQNFTSDRMNLDLAHIYSLIAPGQSAKLSIFRPRLGS
jgi:glycosyltransferase involved in cell wall biosynthesis